MRAPILLRLALAAPLVLGLAACGGGDDVDTYAAQQVTLMGDFAAVLAKVKDKSSAESQRSALESVVAKMTALKAKLDALPADQREPSKEQQAKMEPEMKAALQGLMQEMMRIGQDEGVMAVLQPVLEKMPQ